MENSEATDKEIWECVRTRTPGSCFIFDPDNQPSVARRLDAGEVFWTRLLLNGATMNVPGVGTISLYSDIAICKRHVVGAAEA